METEHAADIYFDPKFQQLYETIEGGRAEQFFFENEYGAVRHSFIRRPIPAALDGGPYYDLVTAYGYGGPRICRVRTSAGETAETAKKRLLQGFSEAYGAYCAEHRIVSEFVRFHPILGNADDFRDLFQVEYLRNTVGTNLKAHPDFMEAEYEKRCRKQIRHALRMGMRAEVIEAPENLAEFSQIYEETMDRNGAAEYYYFSADYFTRCLELFREHMLLVNAIYEGKTIASALCFVWDRTVHMHLSGTRREYLHLSPAYLLRYAAAQWASEHEIDLIHHGGGRSNDPQDSLLRFKKQFGRQTEFPFFVGKKIWNEEIYRKLSGGTSRTDGFFPAYRER